MACMCGDTMCPSCGPAQGYDPDQELVAEWMQFHILKDMPHFTLRITDTLFADPDDTDPMYLGEVEEEELAEEITNNIGHKCSQEFIDAIVQEAKRWHREQKK